MAKVITLDLLFSVSKNVNKENNLKFNLKAKMKKFAICKCFYEQNIFIKSWDRHVIFKNESQFRKDYKMASGLEEAMTEAKSEIERRISSREKFNERREFIAENYSSEGILKIGEPFLKDFETSINFQEAFKQAVKWSKEDNCQIPSFSKFLTLQKTD